MSGASHAPRPAGPDPAAIALPAARIPWLRCGPCCLGPGAKAAAGQVTAALAGLPRPGPERGEERRARAAEPADSVKAGPAGQVVGVTALAHDRQARRLLVADAEHGRLGDTLPLRGPGDVVEG